MKKLLGTKNGKRVYASFSFNGLPTLCIAGRQWRGSSLGPANPQCGPDASDVAYWQAIARDAGLIDQARAVIARCMGGAS